MKRAVVLAAAPLLLGGLAYATSGQGLLRGAVADERGQPLIGCQVTRELRLGTGFGGFDGQGHSTGRTGDFALPVNRGFNRLAFTCPGGLHGSAGTVVWRGASPRIAVVLDNR